jgi:hypothetical protein
MPDRIKRNSIERGKILHGISIPCTGLIFGERNIRLPVQPVFNTPVGTNGFGNGFYRCCGTCNVKPRFFFFFFSCRFDVTAADKDFQRSAFSVKDRSLLRNC